MKLTKLSDIFDVKYGVNLEYNAMIPDRNGIPFVSRQSKNNGVVGRVALIETVKPNPANTISVAGGGSVMESFLQKEPYYSGRDLYYLSPKTRLTDSQLLYYCACIRANKYKYSYGRQANRTLKDLLIPSIDSIPPWVESIKTPKTPSVKSASSKQITLNTHTWKNFTLNELFSISASKDKLIEKLTKGGKTPYITSSDKNNGTTSLIKEIGTNTGNTITANRGGSVGYFFYQPKPYQATPVDVRILTPKFSLNVYVGLFLKTVFQQEKYRYNYSRKMGTARLKLLGIRLPSTATGEPNWQFMEDYIKSLPYSQNLAD